MSQLELSCNPALQRLERVFLVLGLFDLFIFFICILNNLLSPVPVGFLLIFAGLLLRYKKINSVGLISEFSRIFAVGIPVGIGLILVDTPLSLLETMMQRHLFYYAYGAIVTLALFVVSVWTARILTQDTILQACKEKNVRIMKSTTMLLMASLIIVGITFLSVFSDVDEFKERAKERAIQQTAGKYEYYVNAIKVIKSDSETVVRAKITAWNEDEIKEIPVEWKE